MEFELLERSLGINFNNQLLLRNALTHKSWANEFNGVDYGTLKSFGSMVLEMLIMRFLYLLGDLKEPEMARIRIAATEARELAKISDSLNLPSFIRLGNGEEKSGARTNPNISADCLKALLGAIDVDRGHVVCQEFFAQKLEPFVEQIMESGNWNSPKNELITAVGQELGTHIKFRILGNDPIDNPGKLTAVVILPDGTEIGRGIGNTTKEAKINAALNALKEKHYLKLKPRKK